MDADSPTTQTAENVTLGILRALETVTVTRKESGIYTEWSITFKDD